MSSLFWDVTQRYLVVCYQVSEQPLGPIFFFEYSTLEDLKHLQAVPKVGSKYKPMQRNIHEQRRPQPHAASVEEPLWQFHIEGLHVIFSGVSNSVTKQTDNCVTGKAADSIYHRSKVKSFNLSNYYWIVQELVKAHHSNSHNPIHSTFHPFTGHEGP